MKPLGIVRKIDELGRIVLPKEIRKANGWEQGQPMEMFADNDGMLYMKAYGDDPGKKEIVEALSSLLEHTDHKEVSYIARKAIAFIQERK